MQLHNWETGQASSSVNSPVICPCHIQADAVTLEKTFALCDTRLIEVDLNWFGKQVSEQYVDIHPYYYTQTEFNSSLMTQK